MSDGDNSTTGRHGRRDSSAPDGTSDTNQWLTRSARPSPGAAPWERGGAGDGEDATASSAPGNHTDGVTVADLIAKLNGDRAVPPELKRHPPEAATPPTPPTDVIAAVPAYPGTPEPGRDDTHAVRDWPMDPAVEPAYPDSPDTEVIPVTPAGMSELPDLTLVHRRGRVPPSHIGSGRLRTDQDHPHRGRHRTMIAGRAIAAVIAVLALALTGGAWQWQSAKNNMLNRVSALDPDSRDILDPNAQFGDENFLIVGVDSRIGREQRHGGGHHRRRCRRKVGHRDAGEHPRESGTRCGRVLSARPDHRADGMRAVESRDRRIRPDHRPRVTDVRGRRGVHRVQAELRVRRRWTQVPGQGRFRNYPACT